MCLCIGNARQRQTGALLGQNCRHVGRFLEQRRILIQRQLAQTGSSCLYRGISQLNAVAQIVVTVQRLQQTQQVHHLAVVAVAGAEQIQWRDFGFGDDRAQLQRTQIEGHAFAGGVREFAEGAGGCTATTGTLDTQALHRCIEKHAGGIAAGNRGVGITAGRTGIRARAGNGVGASRRGSIAIAAAVAATQGQGQRQRAGRQARGDSQRANNKLRHDGVSQNG